MKNPGVNDTPISSEERVDATLEDSFPASDAPSWTLGVHHAGAAGAPVESDAPLEDIVFPVRRAQSTPSA